MNTRDASPDQLPDHGPPAEEAGVDFVGARRLKRDLLAELRSSWEEGEPLAPEDVLPRWPGEPAADPDVASVLFEDYLQRQRKGGSASFDSYSQRFPEHADSLAGLIRQHDLMRSLGADASAEQGMRLPELGEEFFGFHLCGELGRGAFARVFLAEQTELAGRPVVLKVSRIEGGEAQTLAQLQHTHIVPIFSVHDDARAGVRALCMPYFGGASLSQVLRNLWEKDPRPTRGQALIDALDRTSAPRPRGAVAPAAGAQTPRATLGRLGYIRAAAWIAARLAEGLQHAHDRRVLHRDIKPSNVLVGADGQPMLLDFNLAQNDNDAQASATLGGTVSYMSPEHLHALASRDPALAPKVDERSDVYSLGMVLFEMLAGQSPFEQSASYSPLPVLIESMAVERGRAAPSVRRVRPDVPWGLESILRQALAPDPFSRYQRAEDMAEDLRRFLSDHPLRFAPELSLAERAHKWVRRHPRLAYSGAVCLVAAVLLLGVGLALAWAHDRLAITTDQLEDAQAQDRKRAYEAGSLRALYLVNTRADGSDYLHDGLQACEKTLSVYGVLDRADWEEHPDWKRLSAEDRLRMAEDTRDLLLLLAQVRVRLAPGDKGVVAQALGLLERAERIPDLPPCKALWMERAAYRKQLGDESGAAAAAARADQIKPSGAHDHYLLAMVHVRAGKYDLAVEELDEALRQNPQHYWSWAQRGLCRQEQGEPALAAADFGACVGLWPEFSWGYFNRGCALAECGKRAEAVKDYTSALRCDPELLPAYLNRGLLRLELEQYGPALEDFDAAVARGRDDAFVHSGRGVALERLGRVAEADKAFAAADRRAADLPRDARLRLLWVYGFAIASRSPKQARKAFDEVLAVEPSHPQALYGRGMLLERQGQTDEALECYAYALEASPGFMEARRSRAVALARRGDLREAEKEINLCLDREPHSGVTLYAAACVAALAARRGGQAAPGAVDQALDLLRQAFARGYGRDKVSDDRDLDSVRGDPRFRPLLEGGPAR